MTDAVGAVSASASAAEVFAAGASVSTGSSTCTTTGAVEESSTACRIASLVILTLIGLSGSISFPSLSWKEMSTAWNPRVLDSIVPSTAAATASRPSPVTGVTVMVVPSGNVPASALTCTVISVSAGSVPSVPAAVVSEARLPVWTVMVCSKVCSGISVDVPAVPSVAASAAVSEAPSAVTPAAAAVSEVPSAVTPAAAAISEAPLEVPAAAAFSEASLEVPATAAVSSFALSEAVDAVDAAASSVAYSDAFSSVLFSPAPSLVSVMWSRVLISLTSFSLSSAAKRISAVFSMVAASRSVSSSTQSIWDMEKSRVIHPLTLLPFETGSPSWSYTIWFFSIV